MSFVVARENLARGRERFQFLRIEETGSVIASGNSLRWGINFKETYANPRFSFYAVFILIWKSGRSAPSVKREIRKKKKLIK